MADAPSLAAPLSAGSLAAVERALDAAKGAVAGLSDATGYTLDTLWGAAYARMASDFVRKFPESALAAKCAAHWRERARRGAAARRVAAHLQTLGVTGDAEVCRAVAAVDADMAQLLERGAVEAREADAKSTELRLIWGFARTLVERRLLELRRDADSAVARLSMDATAAIEAAARQAAAAKGLAAGTEISPAPAMGEIVKFGQQRMMDVSPSGSGSDTDAALPQSPAARTYRAASAYGSTGLAAASVRAVTPEAARLAHELEQTALARGALAAETSDRARVATYSLALEHALVDRTQSFASLLDGADGALAMAQQRLNRTFATAAFRLWALATSVQRRAAAEREVRALQDEVWRLDNEADDMRYEAAMRDHNWQRRITHIYARSRLRSALHAWQQLARWPRIQALQARAVVIAQHGHTLRAMERWRGVMAKRRAAMRRAAAHWWNGAAAAALVAWRADHARAMERNARMRLRAATWAREVAWRGWRARTRYACEAPRALTASFARRRRERVARAWADLAAARRVALLAEMRRRVAWRARCVLRWAAAALVRDAQVAERERRQAVERGVRRQRAAAERQAPHAQQFLDACGVDLVRDSLAATATAAEADASEQAQARALVAMLQERCASAAREIIASIGGDICLRVSMRVAAHCVAAVASARAALVRWRRAAMATRRHAHEVKERLRLLALVRSWAGIVRERERVACAGWARLNRRHTMARAFAREGSWLAVARAGAAFRRRLHLLLRRAWLGGVMHAWFGATPLAALRATATGRAHVATQAALEAPRLDDAVFAAPILETVLRHAAHALTRSGGGPVADSAAAAVSAARRRLSAELGDARAGQHASNKHGELSSAEAHSARAAAAALDALGAHADSTGIQLAKERTVGNHRAATAAARGFRRGEAAGIATVVAATSRPGMPVLSAGGWRPKSAMGVHHPYSQRLTRPTSALPASALLAARRRPMSASPSERPSSAAARSAPHRRGSWIMQQAQTTAPERLQVQPQPPPRSRSATPCAASPPPLGRPASAMGRPASAVGGARGRAKRPRPMSATPQRVVRVAIDGFNLA